MDTLSVKVKGQELTAIMNFMNIMPVIQAFLNAGEGLVNLEANEILSFIKDAKEIQLQQCYINNISDKIAGYKKTDKAQKTQKEKILKILTEEFSKTSIQIETKAKKRLLLLEGNITLAVLDGFVEILKKDKEWEMGVNNNKWHGVLIKVSIIDIYE